MLTAAFTWIFFCAGACRCNGRKISIASVAMAQFTATFKIEKAFTYRDTILD